MAATKRAKKPKKVIEKEPPIIAIYEGKHPHLGHHHKLTLYENGTVKIQREDYVSTCKSRYDGSEITHRQTFETITESQESHRHLIGLFRPKPEPPNIGLTKKLLTQPAK